LKKNISKMDVERPIFQILKKNSHRMTEIDNYFDIFLNGRQKSYKREEWYRE